MLTCFKRKSFTILHISLLLTVFGGSKVQASLVNIDLGGSFKSFVELQRLRQQGIYQYESIPMAEERLRLQGVLSNKWLRIEAANEASFIYQKYNPTTVPIPDFTPVSAWRARWTIIDKQETTLIDRMDRLLVQLTYQSNQLIIGKQVIATGVGQIFGAVSQVQRYPFIVIDSEYEKTEDAVTWIWSGPFQMEARFLPKTRSQKQHNFHVRAKGSKGGYDVALTAGRSDDKVYAGLESAGNLVGSVLRGEVVGYNQNGKDYLQGLIGWDYVFSATWSSKIEAFYNGFGKASNYRIEPYLHRSAPYRGRWYVAAVITWETTALLKSNLLVVSNLQDPSFLLHLYFNYSLGNSIDLIAGQYMSFGEDDAEFGGRLPVIANLKLGQPDITYLALRWYF